MRAGKEPSGAPGGSPVSSRALSQALKFSGAEVLRREVPVHQMVEEGLDEVGAPVLIVEIVGVLPDVAGEDWRLAVRQGGVGVAGADHLQVIAVLHQPDPAAAELAAALGLELFLKLVAATTALAQRARKSVV